MGNSILLGALIMEELSNFIIWLVGAFWLGWAVKGLVVEAKKKPKTKYRRKKH